MTEQSDSYSGRYHLVWRNLAGLFFAALVFTGIWALANEVEGWTWRVVIGGPFAAYAWISVLFISARGH